MFRVMTGLHHSITISFLVVGHTKLAPNGCFRLLKREFEKTEVADLEQVVQSSAVVNESQLVAARLGSPLFQQQLRDKTIGERSQLKA